MLQSGNLLSSPFIMRTLPLLCSYLAVYVGVRHGIAALRGATLLNWRQHNDNDNNDNDMDNDNDIDNGNNNNGGNNNNTNDDDHDDNNNGRTR